MKALWEKQDEEIWSERAIHNSWPSTQLQYCEFAVWLVDSDSTSKEVVVWSLVQIADPEHEFFLFIYFFLSVQSTCNKNVSAASYVCRRWWAQKHRLNNAVRESDSERGMDSLRQLSGLDSGYI